MTTTFRLPDLGEGVHEAEILAVAVKVGQEISEGDLMLEVETDKAAVEIPSPVTGTITSIEVQPGDMAKVGDVLITFTPSGDNTATQAADTKSSAPSPNVQATSPAQTKKLPVPAAPSTRRLARELGVDLHEVTPTGNNGIVTAEDVRQKSDTSAKMPPETEEKQAAARADVVSIHPKETASLPDFSQFGPIERQPFRSIRRATAQRMWASWSQIPHVNCQDNVDITLLEDFRQRHKTEIQEAGGRLTMTVFALKAVATALKKFPHFNASLDLEHQEIIIKHYYHIGLAVDTEHGLMVPVIRDVDRKSIKELSLEVHEAISRARQRASAREELIGGSFTITNAGAVGGSHFSAIINHPEIAILGLGQARMQPAAVLNERGKYQIAPRLLMPIILCFDHRVADGADAIRFLQIIINSLQDPDELLISMV